MSAPKVKLPSIAELTSMSDPKDTQVSAQGSTTKSLPISESIASVPLEYPLHSQVQAQPLALHFGFQQIPAYHYYAYDGGNTLPPFAYSPPNVPLHYQAKSYAVVGAGAYAQHPEAVNVYSVPEVLNKPMNECHRCGTTETPEWRRGPNGLRTLCNACGLFHAKLVKRKGAALAAEEVLNNKVCKGKNGRRVCVKRKALSDSKKKMSEVHVTDIPPISQLAPEQKAPAYGSEYYYLAPRQDFSFPRHVYGAGFSFPQIAGNLGPVLPVIRN